MLSICKHVILAVALAAMAGCSQGGWTGRESPPLPPTLATQAAIENSLSPLAASDEELWIIGATDSAANANNVDLARIGSGQIEYQASANSVLQIEPSRTDVRAQITGFLAVSTVNQTFVNSTNSAVIDADYRFVLPADSEVNDFTMTIGQRHIRGIVRPKDEAEHIYQSACVHGAVARLLSESGPGVFHIQLGNLDPGKPMEIQIAYAQTLQYRDGRLRYHYCAQGPTSLSAHIEAGAQIDGVQCNYGGADIRQSTPNSADVELRHQNMQMSTAMEISYGLAGDGPHALYVTQNDPCGGGYAALMVMGGDLAHAPRLPIRLSVLIDGSAPMDEYQQYLASTFVQTLLRGLDERDQFQIDFTSRNPVDIAQPHKIQADLPAAIGAEIKANIADSSTTSLLEHLRAIGNAAPPQAPSIIPWLVVITNEDKPDLIATMKSARENFGSYRLAIVGPDEFRPPGPFFQSAGSTRYPVQQVDHVLASMNHPTLTQLSIDWKSAQMDDIFPSHNLDVFPERPLVLMAHYKSAPPTTITLQGYSAGKPVSIPVTAIAADAPGIDRLWARRKMADLAAQYVGGGDESLLKQITQVAMDHGMVSPFTSILMVDAAQRAPAPK